MGHRLLGATMAMALAALAVAVAVAGYTRTHPVWWEAAISLAVLAGIFPMILAVNTRIVPVFSRRDWASGSLVRAMVVLALIGGWVVFLGRMSERDGIVILGSAVSLAAGVLFLANIGQLFKQKTPVRPAPPLPYPAQTQADRIAINFTRLSAVWLLVGLVIGLVTSIHTPETGRWELVWAHAMLVGFAFSMATGVTYHVLPRELTAKQIPNGETYVRTLKAKPDRTLLIDKTKMGVTVDKAHVVKADVMADNGVIHVIDTVLIPSK